MKKTPKFSSSGQALLYIILLSSIALTLAFAATSLSVSHVQESIIFQNGEKVYFLAEAALENGLIRFLRNPNYSGESLQLETVPCIIETATPPLRLIASCNNGSVIRKVQATISFQNGQMQVGPIQEIP